MNNFSLDLGSFAERANAAISDPTCDRQLEVWGLGKQNREDLKWQVVMSCVAPGTVRILTGMLTNGWG